MCLVLDFSGGVEKALNTAVYVSGELTLAIRGKELDLFCGAICLGNILKSKPNIKKERKP